MSMKNEMYEAKLVVKQNLATCCDELLDLDDNEILPDGKIREIAESMKSLSYTIALNIVAEMVKKTAMEYVVINKS